MRRREDDVLAQFCRALAILDERPATIVDRPDRASADGHGCDAMIERNGTVHAIEHATIDSFPHQRLDDARLDRVLQPIVDSIGHDYPALSIRIIIPTYAVGTGTHWDKLATTFHRACVAALGARVSGQDRVQIHPPGLFPIRIHSRDGLMPGCYIVRIDVDRLEKRRVDVIAATIVRKQHQLSRYRKDGLPTMLLLDFDDLANANAHVVASAFAEAGDRVGPVDIDEVWLADLTERPAWFYPVKLGPRRYPDLSEFRAFFEAQYRLNKAPW